MAIRFVNNYSSTVTNAPGAAASSFVVSAAPTFTSAFVNGTDEIYLVVYQIVASTETKVELVKCTSISGTTLTVTRAQEGTSAQDYSSGTTYIECRPTAAGMDGMAQKARNLADLGDTNTALNNILPSQATHSGKFLTTNATDTSWTTIEGITLGGTTPLLQVSVDNLRLDGNTLSSTNADGAVVVAPNGTGDVQLDADTVRIGDLNANATLTTNGTGDLILSTNSGTNSGTITIFDGANGNIELAPNGTGDVYVTADTLRVGDSNTDATITTNGTGDLILNTNAGTNSGTIRIYDAANGNIELTPNGTGDVQLLADTVVIGDANANATLTTNGTGDLILSTNSGTNSGTITIFDAANGNIELAPNGTGDVYVTADTLRVGDSNTDATITTNGTGDLILNTNAGTNSGSITIADAANGTISITPNGTGVVALGPVTFTTNASVTAGTNAQGQGALTADYNVITTAASNPSGATLPTAVAGRSVVVVNKGANAVNVYPATGAYIDALAINTAISLGVGSVLEFNASSATQWYSSNSIGSVAGMGSGVATFLATPSSANLKTALTDELGSASGKVIFAEGTLAITSGKTLTSNNTLTLAGTDSTTMTFPSTSQTVAGLGVSGQTFTTEQTLQLTDAGTNTVLYPLMLDRQSSGTPAAGIGVGLRFEAETAAGNTETGAAIEAVTTDVTAASEDFDLVFKTMKAGAAASESARCRTAAFDIPAGFTYNINNTSVLSATALGSGVTGSSLTSVGTIASGTWQGTQIGAAYGGTGQASYTIGDLLYASGATAVSKLAAVATGSVLASAGVGTAPAWSSTPSLTSLATITITPAAAASACVLWNTTLTTGSISMGNAMTTGAINIGNGTARTTGAVNIASGAAARSTSDLFNLGNGAGTIAASGTLTGNIMSGATTPASGTATRVLNMGVNGGANLTTNVNIGSTNLGTITLNSPLVSVVGRTVNAALADNDGSFDLTARNNFTCTPSGGFTFTFTNIASASGQSGMILLVNGSNYAIAAHANTKIDTSDLASISTTGTYLLSYFCNGTNVYVVVSKDLT